MQILVVAAGLLGGVVGGGVVLLQQRDNQRVVSVLPLADERVQTEDVVENIKGAIVSIHSDEGVPVVGTGFVISQEGEILTNAHIVSDEDTKYFAVTTDKRTFPIKDIKRDNLLDIALVKIEAFDLPIVSLGNSSEVKPGQPILVIGNAFGLLDNTVTSGIVSGINRRVVAGDRRDGSASYMENLIQVDAAINPGGSGGPLINQVGEVVGVNVAANPAAENIGFAIPINEVKQSLKGMLPLP